MYIRAIRRAALLCSTILSFNAFAAGDRVDYDLDNDGLIEINDLADLNEIRNHLDGAALYGDSTGCPEGGCNGFELTTDLDFDTNGDGQMNELDTYWSNGEGWEPIGSSSSNAFTGDFHGNGHQVRNLYIDRSGNAGLFGYIEGTSTRPSTITKLAITGLMTSITGRYETGVLAGRINYAEVDRIFVSGIISSQRDAGGLAGDVSNSNINNVFSSAATLTGRTQGGLVGRITNSALSNNLSTGYVENGYGLLGYSYNSTNANLHWATDTSGQETSRGTNASYFGALLSELQCPTLSDNNTCTDRGTLFESWSSEVWDFGTGQQLPGLIMGGRIYRDSDGDGSLDEDDAYPGTFAASLDTDEDGYPDRYSRGCSSTCVAESGLFLDAFPENSTGWLDADLDGLVDEWADGCDTTCQTNSGLSYDDYPDDHDNDGITDAVDTDDNNDGITDADADSDGLIDVASLEELNAIRFALDGSGQVMTEESLSDTSGCPIILWQGTAQQRCHGYELISDLDFDTNGDGQMSELDAYWNDGEGWEPIGPSISNAFTAAFDGNGHQIRNLYIDRASNAAGLFGYIEGTSTRPSIITKLAITGPMTSFTGRYVAGVLAGRASYTNIDHIFASGFVSSQGYAGGLAGLIFDSTVSNVFSSAAILAGQYQGGLTGQLKDSSLASSLSTGYVENGHGLLRYSNGNNSGSLYWATDTSSQETSQGSHASYFGALLSELQCPTSSDNSTCTHSGTLYESWSSEVWDFGTGQQLPALIMGDRVYRDSDGDGALDEDDAYPDTFAASLDVDEDGYIDSFTLGCDTSCRINSGLILDAFPSSAAAYMDADLDGLVDEWADGCDATCQTNSGLTYDDYPDDRDNDGITDAVDTDDNNDGIIDADADSDGLIDIASLEELSAIRFALDGSGQVMTEESLPDTSGCPIILWQGTAQQRCRGYELTADLDFDTNADGQMNELDAYWNDGEGWEPIGSSSLNAFTGDFNGNGHQIRNLYVDRISNAGLFGGISGTPEKPAEITMIAITGKINSRGSDGGLLVGEVKHAAIDRVLISGSVRASWYAGGLTGEVNDSTVSNVFSSADILAGRTQGGLVGRITNSALSNNLSTGYVENGYGLLGYSYQNNNDASYWATDASGQETSQGTNASYFGALLSELQCPTLSDNNTCTNTGTLYESWSSEVWNFGTGQQLPGLIMGDRVYRDSDGDGALDEDDAYPNTFAASLDVDEDGYIDSFTLGCDTSCRINSGLILDAFPSSAAAYMDADLDGLVDEWADGCDTTCQTSSGLTFDDYPNDHDNDGISDAIDTDDNNDGIVDADADSDGLIDIASLEELNAIRFAPEGSGQVMTEESLSDTSGCPVILWQGIAHQRCGGYELISDLDFDTNGDGQMNELDNYWNDGEGWEPIGSSYSSAFNANFHGNGHQINNLYIDRSGNAGLFGYVNGDELQSIKISEVVLLGPMTSITGGDEAGVLAGRVENTKIDRVFVTGEVNAEREAGGLAGATFNSTVSNVFSSAAILIGNNQGGLIGNLKDSALSNSLATGYVENGYGLLRFSTFNDNSYLYWATDTSGQKTSQGSHASYFGVLLSELQCPTSSDNDTCTDRGTLYESWNNEVWDFGTGQQLPALVMGGRIYRDSDGDGVLDGNDAYPDTFAASLDTDSDGSPDRFTLGCDASCRIDSGLMLDAFPTSAAAYRDTDLDGLVDDWADGCDTTCQTNSGLSYDDYPDDRDNDGITDAVDTDDNNDGIIDADADSDGLIDIASLEELNAIRFALDGSGQIMIDEGLWDNSGCPIMLWQGIAQQRCDGYELVADLDFDTNGDGQMNERDNYWNDGEGWEPIGANSLDPFTTNFHGNGHQIRNLYIDRSGNAGLFGYIEGYEVQPIKISEVVLAGPMTSITGGYHTGVFSGAIHHAKVDGLFISGTVNGEIYVGGLAGRTINSSVSNVFSSAVILEGYNKGGIIGRLYSADLSNSLATGYVEGRGGLIGAGFFDSNEFLYWATDTTGQSTSSGTNASYFGALLSELQCPTSSDNSTCTDKGTLYENWDSEVWDFGSNRQLPGLIMNGVVYRDSDGDGALDEEDAYPDTFAASLDTDKDGYPDNYSRGCSSTCVVESGLFFDAFPDNSAGGLDADLDGLVDKWADSCDTTCQTNSGLSYDDYPNDHDNDGISDAIDTDDNNDGIVDADADSDGLIDIASLEELNAIRFALDGSGQIMIDEGLWDNSGCPIILWEGIAQQRCHGYELIADLDFDTNGDGQMNELDTYWNDGEGWEPIGSPYSSALRADFHGNGHQIRNLYINRSSDAGLFGYILGVRDDLSTITQIAISGPLTSVTGSPDAGLLASRVGYVEIDHVFISGGVSAPSNAGGLAGVTSHSTVSNVFSSAATLDGRTQGGLIGHINGSTLANSLSTGYVKSGGGLLSYSSSNDNSYLYWATDTSSQTTSEGTNDSYFGALLSELQCPTAANNSTCTGNGRLYENWDSDVWDFGSDRQLPGLIMNGVVYRDSDGDGTLDVNLNAPSVALILTQAGREEATIVEGMGDVTIEAIISDEDDWDAHFIEWSSNDINLADSYELGNSITFSSDGLVAGDYTISATVTDNGIPKLSDSAEMTIRVLSNVDPAPAASSGGGGSGGGAIFWLLALLSAPLLMGRVRA